MGGLLTDYDVLVLAAGGLLSLAFGFIPKLKAWYDPQPDQFKAALMLVLVVAVGVGAALLEGMDVLGVVRAVLFAQIGNAATFTGTKHLRARPVEGEGSR